MKKYLVHVDEKVCKGCALCVFYCPKGVLKLADTMNQKGYNIAEVIRLEACIGCRLCDIACPDFAIFVEEDPADNAK